jgi:hypothetical protein
MDPSRQWDAGWRWWLKVGSILLTSVLAAGLIVFGAVRFLDQAQREHDRVECIRALVQRQAKGTADMAAVVLDVRLSVEQRRAAVVGWSEQQRSLADQIGGC